MINKENKEDILFQIDMQLYEIKTSKNMEKKIIDRFNKLEE